MADEVMGAVTHTLELMCFLPLVFRSEEHIFCLIGSGGAVFFFFLLGINLVIIQIYSLTWFAFQTKKIINGTQFFLSDIKIKFSLDL